MKKIKKSINSLFLSSPYPGKQKFLGQPTGLLYALSILAYRKEKTYKNKNEVQKEISCWCPSGVENFQTSKLKKQIINFLETKKPKLVGISTFSVSYKNAVKIKNLIKKFSPETIVVFGGAHEDNFVKYYRKQKIVEADFVIAGDGAFLLDKLYNLIEENPKITVINLKRKIISNKNKFRNLNGAGIILFNYAEKLREIHSQDYLLDIKQKKAIKIDQLPIMPRYLLKDEDSLSRQFGVFGTKKTAQVMVGQGCPYACGFCSESMKKVWYGNDSPKSNFYARTLSHLEKELMELKKSGYQAIFFDDSTFFAKSIPYIKEIIKLLKKYGFEWGCQTTQTSIHMIKCLLKEMKKSGLTYVYIGVEHYNKKLKDSFSRDIGGGNKFNGYKIEETLKLLENHGISIGVSLTFGHPDPNSKKESTKENTFTVKESIDKTKKLLDDFPNIKGVSLNLITYHPGTKISERYEEKIGKLNYIENPNKEEPFNLFEEGIGIHAKGMTEKLAKYILTYSSKNLKKKLWF